MQQQPACWLLCCERDGTTLPFPLVWPRAALEKEEAAGLEVWPSLSSAATDASSGNELETQSTNSNTDSAPVVSRLQSQKGGLPCGSSLQTSSPRAAECGSNGRCHGASAAGYHNAQHKTAGCSSLVPPQQEQCVSLVPPGRLSGCRRAGLLPAGLNQPCPIYLPAVN